MKNTKALSIILFVVILIIGLCFCTQVKAAGNPYFNLTEKNNNWNAYSVITYPEKDTAIVHYLATQDANLKVTVLDSGAYAQDLTSYNLTTDNENVATINASTGEINILTTGDVAIIKGGSVLYKIHVISTEDMQKYNETNDKVNQLMDDIEIQNEEETAGLVYCSPFEEGCIMQGESLQITDMFGKNFSETFPSVKYQAMDETLLSVDSTGKITAKQKNGSTDIYIDFGNNVYKSFSMNVVYSLDAYLDWKYENLSSSSNQGTTPEQTPTETSSQTSTTAKGDELDDEPKTGISTSVKTLVSGLAIISLAIAIITKKN